MTPQIEDIARNLPEPVPMGCYTKDDCIFLLKDISSLMREQGNEEREKAIQSGVHYSEMLPIEYMPSPEYTELFHNTLAETAPLIASHVAIVGEQILKWRGENTVLVSLARAGTPIGVLIKRYIKYKYDLNLPHYSISIIRGKGIDENALIYILAKEGTENIQFIDGWTGKGAINSVLVEACKNFKDKYGVELNHDLAVLADPARCVKFFGTREDFLIPSSCLNSIVSGLVSRTVLRDDIIDKFDFHGAKYYSQWKDIEVSNLFVDSVARHFPDVVIDSSLLSMAVDVPNTGIQDIIRIQEEFGIDDINKVKPGVGETTRVLLRRIPWKIIVDHMDNPNLKHLLLLARDRGVAVEIYKKMSYSCCGLIKSVK